jgi:hypothetical protein
LPYQPRVSTRGERWAALPDYFINLNKSAEYLLQGYPCNDQKDGLVAAHMLVGGKLVEQPRMKAQ